MMTTMTMMMTDILITRLNLFFLLLALYAVDLYYGPSSIWFNCNHRMLFEACGSSNQTIWYMIYIYIYIYIVLASKFSYQKNEIEMYVISYKRSNGLLETICSLTMSKNSTFYICVHYKNALDKLLPPSPHSSQFSCHLKLLLITKIFEWMRLAPYIRPVLIEGNLVSKIIHSWRCHTNI